MNYNLLKKKMDNFFNEVSADQLANELKDLGYYVSDVKSNVSLEKIFNSLPLNKDLINLNSNMPFSFIDDSPYPIAA